MKFKEIEKVLREFGFTNIKQVHNNTQVTAEQYGTEYHHLYLNSVKLTDITPKHPNPKLFEPNLFKADVRFSCDMTVIKQHPSFCSLNTNFIREVNIETARVLANWQYEAING